MASLLRHAASHDGKEAKQEETTSDAYLFVLVYTDANQKILAGK